MTKNQVKALKFIKQYIQENGYSPSHREISHGAELGGPSVSHRVCKGLEALGKITIHPNMARTIEIVE